ncbi:MAG TPA: cell division topological specificity factor MinE [Aggregatilineaceae bacterium]|nr:cell division topological specificity factor MinE [Aggregatilineaceae bacterium]
MTSILDRILGRKGLSSADVARERLKFVLVTDRSDLSPDKLEALQNEIIDVIRRYVHIDEGQVKIKLEQRERENYLVADIPLARNQPSSYQTPVSEPPIETGDTKPRKPSDTPDTP